MPEPLAAFEDDVIEAVADAEGIDAVDLRALLRRQQRLVRDFPDMTVEALVHDWRKAFPHDPLVGQDDRAYYLSVREHVFRDLVGRMELTEAEVGALRAANAEQFRTVLDERADREAIVLTK